MIKISIDVVILASVENLFLNLHVVDVLLFHSSQFFTSSVKVHPCMARLYSITEYGPGMSWQFLVTVITLPRCDPIGGAVDDTRNMTPTVPAEVTTMTHVPAPLLASCLKHLLELELNSTYDVISIHSHVKIYISPRLNIRPTKILSVNFKLLNGFTCLSITGSFWNGDLFIVF